MPPLRYALLVTTRLPRLLDALEAEAGPAPPPPTADPFALVLLENVVYLASDEKRLAAFRALKKQVGLKPTDVLEASPKTLLAIARSGGIVPENQVGKLVRSAEIALSEFGGSLREASRKALPAARKAIARFPSIGAPGAERILLLSGAHAILGLESNALRVLVRLGYGVERKSFGQTYKEAQTLAQKELPLEVGPLTRAFLLLKRHGQTLCRRSMPRCPQCVLRAECPSASAFARKARG